MSNFLFYFLYVCISFVLFSLTNAQDGDQLDYTMKCPRGYYQDESTNPVLLNTNECIPCPRGRFGLQSGVKGAACSGGCPVGRYGTKLASESEDDCILCPPGTYGSRLGLSTPTCTAQCPPGKYSRISGATVRSSCIDCDPSYRGNQCNFSKRGYTKSGILESCPVGRYSKISGTAGGYVCAT